MGKICIIAGSKKDEPVIQKSKIFSLLEKLKIDYEYSIISSDKNPQELADYCNNHSNKDAVFIAIAGGIPALPMAIKARLPTHNVISVPINTSEHNAKDVILSVITTPSQRPIIIAGLNEDGLKKSIYVAAQILSLCKKDTKKRLEKLLRKKASKALIAIKVKNFK